MLRQSNKAASAALVALGEKSVSSNIDFMLTKLTICYVAMNDARQLLR